MYKLRDNYSIIRLSDGAVIPAEPANADYQSYLRWSQVAGNVAEPADKLTPEQIAKEAEVAGASPTARAYFLASPAAVAFIRQTPSEQAAAIDGMTTPQLKTVVKYLAVAVSALVKRELL